MNGQNVGWHGEPSMGELSLWWKARDGKKRNKQKICFTYHLGLVAGESLQNKDNVYINKFHSVNSQMLVGKELCHSH